VTALATLDSFAPSVWKEIRDDDYIPGQNGTLRREQWYWLKSLQEKLSHKMKPSIALGRRKGGMPVGYSR
jgi:hypothetical protein